MGKKTSGFLIYSKNIEDYCDYTHNVDYELEEYNNAKNALIEILRNKLYERVINIIYLDKILTNRQKSVFMLFLNQKTYKEIAEILNLTYTNIPHSLYGIKNNNRYYGGLIKKIKKTVDDDPICNKILYYINQLNKGKCDIIDEISKEYDIDSDIIDIIKKYK